MTTFSPGPWRQHLCNETVVVGKDGTEIAQASGDYVENYEQIEANTRLIAAAPELYELLQAALPYVEDVLSNKEQLACFKKGVVENHAKAIRAALTLVSK